MSRDRVLGSQTIVEVYNPNTGGTIPVGEIDSFDASQNTELKQWQPLGSKEERGQITKSSWKLSIKGGKIDHSLADLMAVAEAAFLAGKPAPKFKITNVIRHFDGTEEIWVYPDTILYNFKQSASAAADEVKEDCEGWAPRRVPGHTLDPRVSNIN